MSTAVEEAQALAKTNGNPAVVPVEPVSPSPIHPFVFHTNPNRRRLVEDAIKASVDEAGYSLEDIMTRILQGQLTLWVLPHHQNGVGGYVVTDIDERKGYRCLFITWIIGADEPGYVKANGHAIMSTLKSFAEYMGCQRIGMHAKPGVMRLFGDVVKEFREVRLIREYQIQEMEVSNGRNG